MTGAIFESRRFSDRWSPAPNGGFRVALYKATFRTSPVVYRKQGYSDHRTLKAAARRLAHFIARQGRSGYTGERYECLYIVTPSGDRLSLTEARKRIAEESSL